MTIPAVLLWLQVLLYQLMTCGPVHACGYGDNPNGCTTTTTGRTERMSEKVTISSRVDLTGDVDVEVTVYDVSCKCGHALTFAVSVDADDDLSVEVERHECEQRERED